jgi:VIT1/CCC1 family predicted Fe2+/Mn2+ transporter
MFGDMGRKGDVLNACVDTITSNENVWPNFPLKSELGLDEPENPLLGALLTFLSFILGALVPLAQNFLILA